MTDSNIEVPITQSRWETASDLELYNLGRDEKINSLPDADVKTFEELIFNAAMTDIKEAYRNDTPDENFLTEMRDRERAEFLKRLSTSETAPTTTDLHK